MMTWLLALPLVGIMAATCVAVLRRAPRSGLRWIGALNAVLLFGGLVLLVVAVSAEPRAAQSSTPAAESTSDPSGPALIGAAISVAGSFRIGVFRPNLRPLLF